MKKTLLASVLLGFGTLTVQATAADAELNLYSARHYQTDEALYSNFTKRTGIKVNRIEAKEDELLNRVCELIVDIGKYRLAWVGFAMDDEQKSVKPVAEKGFNGKSYVEMADISWADTERGRGPTGTAIRTGKTVMIVDAAP